ncbi:hypothetical protein Tco_0287053 [Tanacetum coccineum]
MDRRDWSKMAVCYDSLTQSMSKYQLPYLNAVNTVSPNINTGSFKLNVVGPSVSTASPNEEDSTKRTEIDFRTLQILQKASQILYSRTTSLSDSSWVEAMHEELPQFKLQRCLDTGGLPKRKEAIGTNGLQTPLIFGKTFGQDGDADDVWSDYVEQLKIGSRTLEVKHVEYLMLNASPFEEMFEKEDNGLGLSFPKFAETHNVVAFLEKPEESDGFAEIIDFLKASSVSYALTVNPVIYTSHIEQFWATAKSSIRRDLHLDDAEGIDCLPTANRSLEELARMGIMRVLGAPEDCIQTGRSIKDIDQMLMYLVVDETQKQNDDTLCCEAFTTASEMISVVPKTIEQQQQHLQDPKDKGVVVKDPSEFRVHKATQPKARKEEEGIEEKNLKGAERRLLLERKRQERQQKNLKETKKYEEEKESEEVNEAELKKRLVIKTDEYNSKLTISTLHPIYQ